MKLFAKFQSAVVTRWRTITQYIRCSPGIAVCRPWLLAALVRTRLLRGSSVGTLEIPMGARGESVIRLDTSSGSEMDIFQEVVVCGNYPIDKLPFVPVLVADCGANVGFFSGLARLSFPGAEIFAWEPDEQNFRRLSDQPVLQDARASLVNAAVSDHAGRVSLTGVGHGCEVKGEADDSGGVECIDFGAWWHEHARSHALLKMDIEGHETAVLPALRGIWKAPCAVFLETHAPHGADDELINQLEDDGFRVELLRAHSLPNEERVFREYLALLG